jgi:hypothetical protein
MEEIRALDEPAVERLRAFARTWSLWFMKNIERASIYDSEWKHLTGDRRKKVLQSRHEYEKRVREIIEDVQREGDAAPGLDPKYACFFLLSAINGLSTWYRRRGKDSAEHIADAYTEMIVGMVCNSNGPSKPSKAKRR